MNKGKPERKGKLESFFADPVGGVKKATSPISRLWLGLLIKLRVGPPVFRQCVERWVERAALNPAIAKKSDKSSIRNNLISTLFDEDKMTHKTLLRGVEVLGAQSAELILRVTFPNGRVEEVRSDFKFSANAVVGDDDDSDE